MESEGILVGTNQNHEWLLPWWWMHYRTHNDFPVTFVDFGDMSKKALQWCERHGQVIALDQKMDFIRKKEEIAPETAKLWQEIHPDIWNMRKGWFQKPFALLKTPYEKTLWLDADCQVRGPLKPLFPVLNECDIALIPEAEYSQRYNLIAGITVPGETVLNAGVIFFKKNAPVIQEWAKQALTQNHLHFGDQQLLVRVIFSMKFPYIPLPRNFNAIVEAGIDTNAVIIHWSGRFKQIIKDELTALKQIYNIDLFNPS